MRITHIRDDGASTAAQLVTYCGVDFGSSVSERHMREIAAGHIAPFGRGVLICETCIKIAGRHHISPQPNRCDNSCMTNDERRQQMRLILDRHDEALARFRASRDAADQSMLAVNDGADALIGAGQAMADAIQHLQKASRAMHSAVTASVAASAVQRDAIDAVMAANQAALALWNDDHE